MNLSSRFFTLVVCASWTVSAQNMTEITYDLVDHNHIKTAKLYFNDTASLFVYNKSGWDTGFASQTSMLYNEQGMMLHVSEYDSTGLIIYRNFVDRTIKLRQPSIRPLDAFTVDDSWVPIVWNIDDSFKIIAGYKCYKARGFFRGRYYTAWFTREIPKPYGPWKLFGLPGLILEAYDAKGVFRASVNQIQDCADNCNVIAPPNEPENKTMKEYVYFLDHIFEMAYKKIQRSLAEQNKQISVGDPVRLSTIKERRDKSYESVYEWERKGRKNTQLIKSYKN